MTPLEKMQKVAKMIVLLNNLEEQLISLRSNLFKAAAHNPQWQSTISEKLHTIEPLLDKLRKARLNLNYLFLSPNDNIKM